MIQNTVYAYVSGKNKDEMMEIAKIFVQVRFTLTMEQLDLMPHLVVIRNQEMVGKM